MKPIVKLSILLLAFLLAPLTGSGKAAAQPIAFTDVTVIDVEEGAAQSEMTVVVTGDRITSVDKAGSVKVPDDATVIDGRGKYLIPGLWDMHAHAARAGRALRFWPLLLAHGVTGFREMGSFADSLLHWRKEAERPTSLAPRVHWASPLLDGEPAAYDHAIAVPDAGAAATVVDSLQRLGFDLLKVYTGLSREAYFALAEEAKQRGIPFAGHVPLSVTPTEASDAGQWSFEHVTDLHTACTPGARALYVAYGHAVASYGAASDSARAAVGPLAGALAFSEPDPSVCGELLERMAENGTWFTPTLTVYRMESLPSSFDEDPRMQRIPDAVAERWREGRRMTPEQEVEVGVRIWENALRTVALAHRAGVRTLAGTDASDMPYIFAGSSLHDELAHLVKAGLTPSEALQAATLNPARYLGREGDLGTVEEGKLADLVLLEANPLEDVQHTQRIRAVVVNGRLLDRATLDGMVEVPWATTD